MPVTMFLVVVYVASLHWTAHGNWVNPVYCGISETEQPPFIRLDRGTKLYETRKYPSEKWMCTEFRSSYPHTKNAFYLLLDYIPRHWSFWTLMNYIKGDNSEGLIIPPNLPVRTHMYYTQGRNGTYLKEAHNFRLCFYLTLDNAPAPNNCDIDIGVEPEKTYYVWQYKSNIFDALKHEAELATFRRALNADGVVDFNQTFHITSSYGPFINPNVHNEIWLEKL